MSRRPPASQGASRPFWIMTCIVIFSAGLLVGRFVLQPTTSAVVARERIPPFEKVVADHALFTSLLTSIDQPAPPPLKELDDEAASAIYNGVRMACAAPHEPVFVGWLGKAYLAHSMHERAAAAFDAASALDPKDWQWVYFKAYAATKQAQNTEAIEHFEKVVELHPDYSPTYANLGELYIAQGEQAKAEAVIREYIEREPEDQRGHLIRGEAALARGDYTGAITFLKQALQFPPENQTVYRAIGRAYQELGDERNAEIYLRRARTAQDIIPGNDPIIQEVMDLNQTAAANQARYAVAMMQENYPAALPLAQRLTQQRPQDPDVWAQLAKVFWQLKQFGEADKAAQQALAIDPDAADPHVALALIHRDAGRLEPAKTFADKAVELDPTYDPAWYAKAYIYQAIGQESEALTFIQKAVELRPDHRFYWQIVAQLAERVGEVNTAITAMERYLELQPGNAKAEAYLQELRSKDPSAGTSPSRP